jgi:hypothetical protein
MATAILLELRGVTQEQYDAVWRDLGTGGRLLPGNTFHIGGPTRGRWTSGNPLKPPNGLSIRLWARSPRITFRRCSPEYSRWTA